MSQIENDPLSCLVLDYVKTFPEIGSSPLTSKILEENRDRLFDSDWERIYLKVRYYRGARGKASRRSAELHGITYVQQPQEKAYMIPPSEAHPELYVPYRIPKEASDIVIMGDLHIPYHDEVALQCVLDYIWDNKNDIDGILLNGDVADFYQIKHFRRFPDKPRLKYELDCVSDFVRGLRKMHPDCWIWYKEGNHEERWTNYLLDKAPELYGISILELDEVLHLSKNGITYIKDKRDILAGKLLIMHGHEYRTGANSPVSPARTAFLKGGGVSMAISHYHRTSEHTVLNARREIITTWSLGCLCSLTPDYDPKNQWNHGFARVKIASDGTYEFDNFRIYEGRIL